MITSSINQDENSSTSTLRGQQGQTFFEFMMLLLILVMISTVMLTRFRAGVSGYWRGAAYMLCMHGQTLASLKTKCDDINN